MECVTKNFLCQHVNFPTTDKSVLDLILTSKPELVCNMQDLGAFYTSDHKMLGFNLDVVKDLESSNSTRFDYKRMDIKGAQEELKSFNWNEELNGTVEQDWDRLKEILFLIQHKYVSICKQSRRNKKLWLSYKAIKCVQNKHRVFKKYKDSSHPACKRASNKASKEVRRAKYNYEKKLAENIKKDSKSFLHVSEVGQTLLGS